jgi:hypothetical protein
MSSYERLAELAELQVETITAGRLDDLAPLLQEWVALTRTLPVVPPPDAATHLQKAQAATESMQATLESALAAVREEIVAVAAGRRVACGYGGGHRPPAFETHG